MGVLQVGIQQKEGGQDMSDMTVRMLGAYTHIEKGVKMVLVAASAPRDDVSESPEDDGEYDYVELWDQYPACESGFKKTWKGSWDEFQKQWMEVPK